jgi:RND family efflux transporter MFP subunit
LVALAARADGTIYDCLIEAKEIVEIRSPVPGILESVPFKRGDTVRKGTVVATLESSVERSAVEAARHRAQAEGAIEASAARVELLGRKFERRRELELNRAVTAQERDDADLDWRLAMAELKQARESRELARIELQRTSAELERRVLRSPFDGLVVEQLLYPGELVDPSGARGPILKLARVDPLRIEVILPVADFARIKLGESAEVFPQEPIGGRYRTTVKVVDRTVHPGSGTFGIRLELANPRLTVPPGIECRVRFGGGR